MCEYSGKVLLLNPTVNLAILLEYDSSLCFLVGRGRTLGRKETEE